MSNSPIDSPFDPFDRREGTGSRTAEDDWLDQHTTAEENQWSTARTTFRVREAPEHKQALFSDLYQKHNGWGEEDRDQTILRSHIVADAKTFVSVLELPEQQQERIINIAEEIDMSSRKFGGKPYEKILLAVISLVVDTAITRRARNEELDAEVAKERMILRDDFRELMDSVDLGSREHRKIRQMLRERTDYF